VACTARSENVSQYLSETGDMRKPGVSDEIWMVITPLLLLAWAFGSLPHMDGRTRRWHCPVRCPTMCCHIGKNA
jgi:hypothetical protein